MIQFIKVMVIVMLQLPILLKRDDGFDAQTLCDGDNFVGVLSVIGE
ncbi:MAG: hypothetical protein ACOX8S_01275 [Christensenellales bacterium]